MRPALKAFLVAALVLSGIGPAMAVEPPATAAVEVANAPAAGAATIDAVGTPVPAPAAHPSDPTPPDDRIVTIVFGGDLGLGGSNQPVLSSGALRHGKRQGWSELTAGIAPLIDGDINFANLETVVTERNDLRANPKAFNFKSHPAGVRHLIDRGFNVFSLANNHALDYGEAGARETVRHLESLADYGLKAWPGLGVGREQAARPADVTVKGARVRISAIGIGGHGLAERKADGDRQRAGMLNYNRTGDYYETIDRLADAEGDLRILSVHYGAELQVRAARADVSKLRDEALRGAGIDIVVGHHAHVPAGVQIVDGSLILYGLGNLLHPGMQDMAGFGICRDYGLLVRVHTVREQRRLAIRAVEVVPLTDMHIFTRPLEGEAGRQRVEVLNHLAAELDAPDALASGVRFAPQPDGRGLYCMPGADREPGRIGLLCKGWESPKPPSAELSRRIASSCGGSVVARSRVGPDDERRAGQERARVSRHRPDAPVGGSVLSSFFGW